MEKTKMGLVFKVILKFSEGLAIKYADEIIADNKIILTTLFQIIQEK